MQNFQSSIRFYGSNVGKVVFLAQNGNNVPSCKNRYLNEKADQLLILGFTQKGIRNIEKIFSKQVSFHFWTLLEGKMLLMQCWEIRHQLGLQIYNCQLFLIVPLKYQNS